MKKIWKKFIFFVSAEHQNKFFFFWTELTAKKRKNDTVKQRHNRNYPCVFAS